MSFTTKAVLLIALVFAHLSLVSAIGWVVKGNYRGISPSKMIYCDDDNSERCKKLCEWDTTCSIWSQEHHKGRCCFHWSDEKATVVSGHPNWTSGYKIRTGFQWLKVGQCHARCGNWGDTDSGDPIRYTPGPGQIIVDYHVRELTGNKGGSFNANVIANKDDNDRPNYFAPKYHHVKKSKTFCRITELLQQY